MTLSKEFLEKQRAALVVEKQRLEQKVLELKKYPNYGGLEDDRVQELTDYETNMSVDDQMELMLNSVDAAIEAIDNGTYGLCKKCKVNIEQGRLEAVPYAELCATCKSKK